jgi:SMC interacting uncharacterized protein involved in chromosome segregation
MKNTKSKTAIKTERSIEKSPEPTPKKKKKAKSKTPKRKQKESIDLDNDASEMNNEVEETIEEPEPLPEAVVVEDDPNMMKISNIDYTKLTMKIQELETKSGGYEMTLGVLKKEKQAMEENNKGLKEMIEDLKRQIQDLSEGEVSVLTY